MRIVSCLALASLLLVPSVCAQTLQMSPGSVCRPAMADDVAKLDFSEGGARNVFDAPGTVAQTATVV